MIKLQININVGGSCTHSDNRKKEQQLESVHQF